MRFMMKMVRMIFGITVVLTVSGCASRDGAKSNTIASVGVSDTINAKLAKMQSFQDTHIVVFIEDGKTVLSGSVHHQKQKFLASAIARSVRGSGTVVNRIVVR